MTTERHRAIRTQLTAAEYQRALRDAREALHAARQTRAAFELGHLEWYDIEPDLTCIDRSGAAADIACERENVARQEVEQLEALKSYVHEAA